MYLNGERFYPVDQKTLCWLRKEYAAKLSANEADGLKQFTSGNPRLFSGHDPEGLKRTYNLVAVYNPRSQDEFMNRVSGPLLDLSNSYGIPAIASGVGEQPDLKPHTTIEVGRISPDLPQAQVEEIMSYMNSSLSHMRPVADILNGLQFRHNSLVVAPNAYTCEGAPDMGQGVALRTRRLILKAMSDAVREIMGPDADPKLFTEPYRYDNLCHASAWRIVPPKGVESMPAQDTLLEFANKAYSIIGLPLEKKPMLLRVGSVIIGDAFESISAEAPHLIKSVVL